MGVSGQEFRVDIWALGSQNGCKQGVTRLQQEVTGQGEKQTGTGTKGSQVKVMKTKPQPSAVTLNSETKARITVGRLSLPQKSPHSKSTFLCCSCSFSWLSCSPFRKSSGGEDET